MIKNGWKSRVWDAGDEEVQRTRSLKGYTPQSEDVEAFYPGGGDPEKRHCVFGFPVSERCGCLNRNCDTAYDDMTKEDTASASMVLKEAGICRINLLTAGYPCTCGATVREPEKEAFEVKLGEKLGNAGLVSSEARGTAVQRH